ncbi:MAG TPA: 2-oxoacid:ferredoxin oxidoreductase subunit beta, partial [bacterium]|nr:2-oxoacid:ferredoxin oxidoreductase subunit beta [bacterium]
MLDVKTYNSPIKVTWCPGCGDYGILNAVKSALAQLEIHPHEVMFFSGIGCGSKLPDYMNANSFTTIHGRALPIAMGTKLANHDLHVICITGDGDGYGIGGNHFINILRRNPDIVHIAENNMVYGLTKGQYAPTSEHGFVTSTTPEGSIEVAFNPLATAINGGATFVARGFSGDPKHLAKLIMAAIQHHGYALVDVLQPCVIYNKINTYDFYRERVYKLDDSGHNPADREAAWRKAQEWGERIPIGIVYQVTGEPT